MSLYRIVLALVVTALFCLDQAMAQERTIRVGVPAGPLVQLVQVLAPALQAQTGIAVTATELNPTAPCRALAPMRLSFRAASLKGSSRRAECPPGSSSRVMSFWWDRGRRWPACGA
jgi:hypothetical protein